MFAKRQRKRQARSLAPETLPPDTFVLPSPFYRSNVHDDDDSDEDEDYDDEPTTNYLSNEDREQGSNPPHVTSTRTTSTGDEPQSFLGSIGTNTTDQGPTRLYHILEEGLRLMPREGDHNDRILSESEMQRRRDLAENIWDLVRLWLEAHPSTRERRTAAYIRSQNTDITTLHLMCKLPYPPADLILAMVNVAPEIAAWTDSNGWLPLHNACAISASLAVIEILVSAFPQGKLKQDSQKRTPLHFYVTQCASNPTEMVETTKLLSDTGAAGLFDRHGMYSIHYAAAYGADAAVLQVLVDVHSDSLTATEAKRRTPLHLAMVNSHRNGMPGVLRFLLAHAASRETINARDQHGFLPLHLLALCLKAAKASYNDTKKANVSECLGLYLDAQPHAYADFLTAIQDLPDWLQDRAVTSRHVRNVLNEKIVHPLPASILMLDAYMLVMIIVCFGKATENHIAIRFNPGQVQQTTEAEVGLLLMGGGYFLLRQLMLVFSLLKMGSFRGLASLHTWCFDAQNWLDVATVFLVFYFGSQMLGTETRVTPEAFRAGVAYTQGILYLNVIVHLQSTYVDFAVFVGGVLHVVQRLTAFITAVLIILVAFAQMFHFTYQDTFLCPSEEMPKNETCKGAAQLYNWNVDEEEDFDFPHCTFPRSFLRVYTMMLGEVGDPGMYSLGPEDTKMFAQLLYVAYAFLVVILLSNVLIAIVTDSYEYIKNDKAALVFWSNRLHFMAEMDALIYGLTADEHSRDGRDKTGIAHMYSQGFRRAWARIRDLFDGNAYAEIDVLEFLVYTILRIFCILFIIPGWLLLGFVSAGVLWPPQIREYLFAAPNTTFQSRSEVEKKKLQQLEQIQQQVDNVKQHMLREITNDQDDILRAKAEIEKIHGDFFNDLQQVKELLTTLAG